MGIKIHDFQWDSGNLEKIKKHGVSLRDVEELFLLSPFVGRDDVNSKNEERYLAYGKLLSSSRHIFVVFTYRIIDNKEYLRPISARYMHKNEVEKHEKEHKKKE